MRHYFRYVAMYICLTDTTLCLCYMSKVFVVSQICDLFDVYRILQIVRGGKVLRMDKVLQIRWKTFAVRSPHQKMCSHTYKISLIERIC